MTYSYLIGFIHLFNFNFIQYIFFSVFAGLITAAFVAYVSFKINSNYKRIVNLLIYISFWFIGAGLIGGGVMLLFSSILYVLIREFSGDYS
tara:strand:+ start:53 stop:325 length:273 start_codon:yes stop_codon:yes gene_type:complete